MLSIPVFPISLVFLAIPDLPTFVGATKQLPRFAYCQELFRADIQRQGSIMAWIVIFSIYGADTITKVKLLSALIS
jgi:hypothetical protein